MYGYVSFRVVLARWWLAKWFVLVTALPETLYLYNSKSSLNINRWKMFFFSGWPIFRGHVSCREVMNGYDGNLPS